MISYIAVLTQTGPRKSWELTLGLISIFNITESSKTRETYASWHMRNRSRKPREQIRRTVTRRFNQNGEILKKSLNGQATWLVVQRTSADCRTTFFRRFKQFGKNLKKSRWTVTRQWSEVTRPSDDCQTTFFRRFKRFGKILKKVTEGHATVVGGHATVGWLSNNVF